MAGLPLESKDSKSNPAYLMQGDRVFPYSGKSPAILESQSINWFRNTGDSITLFKFEQKNYETKSFF